MSLGIPEDVFEIESFGVAGMDDEPILGSGSAPIKMLLTRWHS